MILGYIILPMVTGGSWPPNHTYMYLDAIQYFIDKLEPGLLMHHLLHLYHLTARNQAVIDGNHQHHDGESSKDGWSQSEVEEDQGEYNLKRSRPEGVDVRH